MASYFCGILEWAFYKVIVKTGPQLLKVCLNISLLNEWLVCVCVCVCVFLQTLHCQKQKKPMSSWRWLEKGGWIKVMRPFVQNLLPKVQQKQHLILSSLHLDCLICTWNEVASYPCLSNVYVALISDFRLHHVELLPADDCIWLIRKCFLLCTLLVCFCVLFFLQYFECKFSLQDKIFDWWKKIFEQLDPTPLIQCS